MIPIYKQTVRWEMGADGEPYPAVDWDVDADGCPDCMGTGLAEAT